MAGKVYALIPARAGSKGVKNKNIRNIGGKTLLEWSIQAALKSQNISRVIVSTDSAEYANIAIKNGAEVPFLRPAAIASDTATDYEVFDHFLSHSMEKCEMPSVIVHLRPTTPFRDPYIIDNAIELYIRKKDYSSLRSVHEMPESAYKTFEKAANEQLISVFTKSKNIENSNNARQSFPKTYVANGYVDIISTDHLLKNKKLHGENVFAFETKPTHEVDIESDFQFLEFLLQKNPKIKSQLFDR